MDSGGQFSSVQSGSEQRNPLFQIARGTRENTEREPRQDTPDSTNTNTSANHIVPSFSNQPQVPSVALNTVKSTPEVNRPEFSIPQLPSKLATRRAHDNPDDRTSQNPAHQVLSYPMSYPQDAPTDHKMQHERPEGEERPAQRRKLSSPEREGRPGRSDEEDDSRKTSGTNKASSLSYDPVHETQHASMRQQQPGHSRRPSSANSQRSHISSYSGHSSNPDAEGSSSPITADAGTLRDGKKRKHKCPECGQYFTRLHNLKSHLLTHSQEKPFICDDCGHKFRRLHDLKRHHKLHTGERPYTCQGCNRSFARMDALNRHRKPGGECSLHNMSTSSTQNDVERRMSLPPGFGRPGSSQGSTSPMPQPNYPPSELNINPALAAASHGHSYPPTHLPPKQKHHYHRDPGDASPGLLAPPASTTPFGRSPPPTFGPGGDGRIQPPPLVIPNPNMPGPTLSPIHSHHHSAGTATGSSSSGGRSAPPDLRSPIPPMVDQPGPPYALVESPRGMSPPPLQPHQPLSVPASSLPLPSPGTLISPSPRNSYDRASRQSVETPRPSESNRGYFDTLVERNARLEERVKQLESFVRILWQDRENLLRRQSGDEPF